MVTFTKSFSIWLFKNYKHLYVLIQFGHLELLTKEMYQEYLDWCKTDEAKEYLVQESEE